MAVAAASPDTLSKLQDAIDFLRDAGREEEARAVETLLPSLKPRRLPPRPPESKQELVPIAEAAARLGLSRNAVQRRIESGLLEGVRDERNGYRFVTRESLNKLLDLVQVLDIVSSFSYFRDQHPEEDPTSLTAQMLRYAEGLDRDDRATDASDESPSR
jgi:hypothetical protein